MPRKKIEKDSGEKSSIKKSNSSASISDVSKPGSTPAGPTSRPIIVGHQATLGHDPILSKNRLDESISDPAELKLTKQKKISPLTDNETDKPNQDEDNTDVDKQDEKLPESNDEINSTAAIDALAGEVDAKAQSREQSKAEKEQDDKIQALIDAKRYHLPITEGGKKAASERFATWLLIIMIIAAACAWLAVDAGYLDIGINLPYDLIKN